MVSAYDDVSRVDQICFTHRVSEPPAFASWRSHRSDCVGRIAVRRKPVGGLTAVYFAPRLLAELVIVRLSEVVRVATVHGLRQAKHQVLLTAVWPEDGIQDGLLAVAAILPAVR
eukprot:7214377-Prymnesium_polylepis.1